MKNTLIKTWLFFIRIPLIPIMLLYAVCVVFRNIRNFDPLAENAGVWDDSDVDAIDKVFPLSARRVSAIIIYVFLIYHFIIT